MSQQQQLAILNELVNFVLLEQDAVAKNLDQNPGVAAQLELGRTRLLASAAIGDHLRSQNISDAELQADYERETKENPVMEYKLRHILLDSQEDAEAVVTALGILLLLSPLLDQPALVDVALILALLAAVAAAAFTGRQEDHHD